MIYQKFQALCLKMVVPAMALAIAVPAHAVSVTFSTTGTFACVTCTGSGTSSVTYANPMGPLTLSFTGATQTIALAGGPTTFTGTGSAGSLSSKSFLVEVPITQPTTLNITINQAASAGITAGTGSLSAALTGSVGGAGSTGEIDFAPTSVTIGNVTYTVEEVQNEIGITKPITSHTPGITNIPLEIVATELPEPTFMTLTGLGFAGFALMAYRRRQRA